MDPRPFPLPFSLGLWFIRTTSVKLKDVTTETPWHIRLPRTEHEHWFKNLVNLHDLTQHWIRDLQVDRPAHFLPRGLDENVRQHLWVLENLSSARLEQFLDDQSPGDFLSQLEKAIWAFQSWTLSQILGENKSQPNSPIKNLLEQTSWKAGRLISEARWKRLKTLGKLDLATLFFSLQDSPLSGYPHSRGNLVRRSTQKTVEIELRHCPHQLTFSEIQSHQDLLCQLHSQWCRGFIYTLNPQVIIEHTMSSPRCIQRWRIG